MVFDVPPPKTNFTPGLEGEYPPHIKRSGYNPPSLKKSIGVIPPVYYKWVELQQSSNYMLFYIRFL